MPRKRRESFGAIRQRASGRYQASYVGPDTKRYFAPRTFDTMQDARGWLSIQHAAIATRTWSPVEAQQDAAAKRTDLFGDYATTWLDTRVNRHGEGLRPRTRAEYVRLLNGALKPFETVRIRMVTPEGVRAWYAAQLATGHKTQASRAYGLLNSIMATAVQDGLTKINPCMIRGAQSASTGKKVEPPTPAQLGIIVASIAARYKAMVLLAAWGALRFGELTELRRGDLELIRDKKTVVAVIVNVTRGVTHTRGGYLVGEPKSEAGRRSVALPPHIVPDILEHLKTHTGDFPQSLLFPAADGVTHLSESTFTRAWYPARLAAKRPDLPFHALRHYGATRFAQTGATLKEIQERLGHSTVAAAMRYQHTAGRDQELANRMSDLA